MAALFAAVAGERTGIATEPPVDIDERAAQFARTTAGSVVAVSGCQIVGMLHIDASPHGEVDLTDRFALRDGRIASLEIVPAEAAR
jgi:hypothetical protein